MFKPGLLLLTLLASAPARADEAYWLRRLAAAQTPYEKGLAIETLTRYAGPKSISVLIEVLRNPDEPIPVRGAAARALGVIRGADATEAVVAFLFSLNGPKDALWHSTEWAVLDLARLGERDRVAAELERLGNPAPLSPASRSIARILALTRSCARMLGDQESTGPF